MSLVLYSQPMTVPDAMPPSVTVHNGDTVNMQDGPGNVILTITAAASIAALAVNLPAIPVGCIARIFSTVDVLALTLGGATVLNPVITMSSNDCFSFVKLAAGVFVRCAS